MIIYKITNTLNSKIYVGKSIYNNDSYLGSGLLINRAINKYGKEHFTKEILETCKDIETLNTREKFWIKELNARDLSIGYNIGEGGEFGDVTSTHPNKIEIYRKVSLAVKGFKHTSEAKRKISEAGKGRQHTQASKDKISKANTGKTASLETRIKLSKALTGRKLTDEAKANIGKANIGRQVTTDTRSKISIANTGKSRTVEHKQNMSAARKLIDYKMSDEAKARHIKRNSKPVEINNIKYSSIKHASEQLGIPRHVIVARLDNVECKKYTRL